MKNKLFPLIIAILLINIAAGFAQAPTTPMVGDYAPMGNEWGTHYSAWNYYNGNRWEAATDLPDADANIFIIYDYIGTTFDINVDVTVNSIYVSAKEKNINISKNITTKYFTVGDYSGTITADTSDTSTPIFAAEEILLEGTCTVNFANTYTLNVNSFTVGATVTSTITGRSVITENLVVNGSLFIIGTEASCRVDLSGNVEVTGTFTLKTLSGSTVVIDNFTVNGGTITFNLDNDQPQLGNYVHSGGGTTAITVLSGVTFTGFHLVEGSVTIKNDVQDPTYTVSGDFVVSGGTVNFLTNWVATLTFGGNVSIESGGTCSLSKSTGTISVDFQKDILITEGNLSISSPTDIGDNSYVYAKGNISMAGGTFGIAGVDCELNFSGGNLSLDAGNSNGSNLSIEVKNSTITNSLHVSEGCEFSLEASEVTLNGAITNGGTFLCTHADGSNQAGIFYTGTMINNSGDFTFQNKSDATAPTDIRITAGSFVNEGGTFNFIGNASDSCSVFLEGSGAVQINGGELNVEGLDSVSIVSSYNISIGSNGKCSITCLDEGVVSMNTSQSIAISGVCSIITDSNAATYSVINLNATEGLSVTDGGSLALNGSSVTISTKSLSTADASVEITNGYIASGNDTNKINVQVSSSVNCAGGSVTITGNEESTITFKPLEDSSTLNAIISGCNFSIISGKTIDFCNDKTSLSVSDGASVNIDGTTAQYINIKSTILTTVSSSVTITGSDTTDIDVSSSAGFSISSNSFGITGGKTVELSMSSVTIEENGELIINSPDANPISIHTTALDGILLATGGKISVTGGDAAEISIDTNKFACGAAGACTVTNGSVITFDAGTSFSNQGTFSLSSVNASNINLSSGTGSFSNQGPMDIVGGGNTEILVEGADFSGGSGGEFRITDGKIVDVNLTGTITHGDLFAINSTGADSINVAGSSIGSTAGGEFSLTGGDATAIDLTISGGGGIKAGTFLISGGSTVAVNLEDSNGYITTANGSFAINSPRATTIDLETQKGIQYGNPFEITAGDATAVSILASSADCEGIISMDDGSQFSINGGSSVGISLANGEITAGDSFSVNSPQATAINLEAQKGIKYNNQFTITAGDATAVAISASSADCEGIISMDDGSQFSINGGSSVEINLTNGEISTGDSFSVSSPQATAINLEAQKGIKYNNQFTITAGDATVVAISASSADCAGIISLDDNSVFSIEGGDVVEISIGVGGVISSGNSFSVNSPQASKIELETENGIRYKGRFEVIAGDNTDIYVAAIATASSDCEGIISQGDNSEFSITGGSFLEVFVGKGGLIATGSSFVIDSPQAATIDLQAHNGIEYKNRFEITAGNTTAISILASSADCEGIISMDDGSQFSINGGSSVEINLTNGEISTGDSFVINSPQATAINLEAQKGIKYNNQFTITAGDATAVSVLASSADGEGIISLDDGSQFSINGGSSVEINLTNGEISTGDSFVIDSPQATAINLEAQKGIKYNNQFTITAGDATAVSVLASSADCEGIISLDDGSQFSINGGSSVEITLADGSGITNNNNFTISSPQAITINLTIPAGVTNDGIFNLQPGTGTTMVADFGEGIFLENTGSEFNCENGDSVTISALEIINASRINFSYAKILTMDAGLENRAGAVFSITDTATSTDYDLHFSNVTNLGEIQIVNETADSTKKHSLVVEKFVNGVTNNIEDDPATFNGPSLKTVEIWDFENHGANVNLQKGASITLGKVKNYGNLLLNNGENVVFNDPIDNTEYLINGKNLDDIDRQRELFVIDLRESGNVDFSSGCLNNGLILLNGYTGALSFGAEVMHCGVFVFNGNEALANFHGSRDIYTDSIVEYHDVIGQTNLPFGDNYGSGTVAFLDKASGETMQNITAGCILISNPNATENLSLRGENVFTSNNSAPQTLVLGESGSRWIRVNAASDYTVDQLLDVSGGFEGILLEGTSAGSQNHNVSAVNIRTENLMLSGDAMNYKFTIESTGELTNLAADCGTVQIFNKTGKLLNIKTINATDFSTEISGITAKGTAGEVAIRIECKTSDTNRTPLQIEGNLSCDGGVKVEASTVDCIGDFSSSGSHQDYIATKISSTGTLTFDNKTSTEPSEFTCPEIISAGEQTYNCNVVFHENILLETAGANITVTGTVNADNHNIQLSPAIATAAIEFQKGITALGDGTTVSLKIPMGITGNVTFGGAIQGKNGLSFGEGTSAIFNGDVTLEDGSEDNILAGSITFSGSDSMNMYVTRNLTLGDPVSDSTKATVKLDVNSQNASGRPHSIQVDGNRATRFLIGGNVEASSTITDGKPICFSSSGLLRIYQGAKLDFSAASEFQIEGVRGAQIAGEIKTGSLTVKESLDTRLATNFIDGETDISATATVAFQGNLTVAAGDGVPVKIASTATGDKSFTVGDNLLLLSGTVDLSGCNAFVTKDLIILNGEAATMNNDGTSPSATESGVEQLFAYNTSKRDGKTATPGLSSFPEKTFFDEPIDQNQFFATLALNKLEVAGNFYSNGVDFTGGTLVLGNTDSHLERFAEAYNGTISNLTVELSAGATASGAHAFLSTDKCTDGGGCTNVAFQLVSIAGNKADVETNVVGSGTYSISDHVLRMELTDGTNPMKIENTNNEISEAIKSLKLNNGTVPFVGAYTDAKCTVPTDGAGDLDCIYLVVDKEIHSWKTDATGTSTGYAESTTSSGKTPQSAILLNLRIEKATGSLFHTLRGYNKNRIKNYTTTSDYFTDTEDRCNPVLIQVLTGQEMHKEVPDGQNPSDVQETYDGHNFIEIQYSEPMLISGLDENTVNHKVTETVDETNPGGAISELADGGLNVEGFFSCTKGSLKTGSRGGNASDSTVHSLYRVFSLDGTTTAPRKTRVRIGIAAYAEATPMTVDTLTCYDWKGYIDSAVIPSGTITVTDNIYIRDCSDAYTVTTADGLTLTGNALDLAGTVNTTINNTATAGTLYGTWDVSPPTMAKLLYRHGNTFDWDSGDTIHFGEVVAINTDNEFVNKFECHFFDNTPNYTKNPGYMGNYKWVTSTGWINTSLPQNGLVPAPENRGGSRPFGDKLSGSTATLGGIRMSSLPESLVAFKFGEESQGTGPTIEMGTKFTQAPPSTKIFVNQLNPDTISGPDGLYLTLDFPDAELNRYSPKTVFVLRYTGADGFVTDLAGNRMGDFEVTTFDRSPPIFTLAMAPIGQKKMYIQFNRPMSTAYTSSDGTGYDLLKEFPNEIMVVDGRQQSENSWDPDNPQGLVPDFIDTSVPARLVVNNDVCSSFEISLKQDVTLDAVLNYYIRVKKPTDKRIDPFTGVANFIPLIMDTRGNTMDFYHEEADVQAEHTISDIALGLVDVLYAYDDDIVKDGSIGENLGALRVFDGTGQLAADSDFYIQTMLNNGRDDKTDLTGTLSMFMGINPTPGSISVNFNKATGQKRKAWLPEKLEAFSSEANTDAREFQIKESEDNGMRKFMVSNKSDKTLQWKHGTVPQFMFKYKNSAVEPTDPVQQRLFRPHVFALPLENPMDLTSLGIWSFKLTAINRQRGGVSIFGNVVNPHKQQHATIEIIPPKAGTVTVFVMGIDGVIVKYLHRGSLGVKRSIFTWDGTNEAGRAVARGLYFVRVVGPGIDETRKVMIVK